MKTLILILCLTSVLLSCKVCKSEMRKELNNPAKFEITKTELIENNYIIYAKRNDSVFKIASTKKDTLPCNPIRDSFII